MLTFYSFTTPVELLQLLKQRFNFACPDGLSKEEGETVKTVVRLR